MGLSILVDRKEFPLRLVLALQTSMFYHSYGLSWPNFRHPESYDIFDEVGYMTLRTAGNMDTAAGGITAILSFDRNGQRGSFSATLQIMWHAFYS